MAKRNRCVDCGELCWGKRCMPHFREWQKGEEWKGRLSEATRSAHARGDFGDEWKKRLGRSISRLHGDGFYDHTYESERRSRKISESIGALHAAGHYDHVYEGRMGEHNPNWQGGTSFEPYAFDWPEITKPIRNRDRHTCAVCGALEDGRTHDVHHIDYDKGNNDPSNLVTLCGSCHNKTGKNRNYWVAHFGE